MLVTLGGVLMMVGLALTLGKIGSSTTTSRSHLNAPSAATATTQETATAFLSHLATAIRSGDVTFMVSRLNPKVIADYGASACRATIATYRDPTAAFSVQSTSAPANYDYVVAGLTKVIPDTLTLHVSFTQHGTSTPEVIHLSRIPNGTLTWYTNCRGGQP